jgi:hypothetical protein
VQGSTARLYVNHATQPAPVVLDLKHGAGQRGGIGFWIEPGTIGYLKNFSWRLSTLNPASSLGATALDP